ILHLWQDEFGFISDEGVDWIAAKLELQPINILELVTFYPMFHQAPAGKKHIRVCRTLSCAMAGSYQVMEKTCAAAGIVRHHDEAAPLCMVPDDLIQNVRLETVTALLTSHQSLITNCHPLPQPLEQRQIFTTNGHPF